jgi:hypothetical protein
VGLIAGWLGGWADATLMRGVDAALAIPRLFLLLMLVAVWEQMPLAALVAVLGATGWFATSRIVRGESSGSARRRSSMRRGRSGREWAHYLPSPAAKHRRTTARGRDPRGRRRDPAPGGIVLSRCRRPAAHAILGRHDPRWPPCSSRPMGEPFPGLASSSPYWRSISSDALRAALYPRSA